MRAGLTSLRQAENRRTANADTCPVGISYVTASSGTKTATPCSSCLTHVRQQSLAENRKPLLAVGPSNEIRFDQLLTQSEWDMQRGGGRRYYFGSRI
jgi:hypothetical protein